MYTVYILYTLYKQCIYMCVGIYRPTFSKGSEKVG